MIDQESEIIITMIDIEGAETITEIQGETDTIAGQEKGLTIEIEGSEVGGIEMIEEEKGHPRLTRKNIEGGNRDLDHQAYCQVAHRAHFIQVLAQTNE